MAWGYAKPFLPTRTLMKAGYLYKADSITALAVQIGVDPSELSRTVTEYNRHAMKGEDPEFFKGKSVYGHYLGDSSSACNPNIAPLANGHFYAVWMYPGDIGTFAGLKTDRHARVKRKDGTIFRACSPLVTIWRASSADVTPAVVH